MTRRQFAIYPALAALPALAPAAETLRGRLNHDGGSPTLLLPGGRKIPLNGDEQTSGVLRDARLKNADFEIAGGYNSSGEFEIEPIHKRGMYVWKDGKRLFVTYWCAVCSIRTYTPGICWCCQDETALDLLEKLDT